MSNESGAAALHLCPTYAHAAQELAKELPRHVRDRALHAAERLQTQSRREQENGVTVYPAGDTSTGDGGYYMTFRQGRGADMLMSVTLYAPDKATAEAMRLKFLQNPGKLYSSVIESFG